MSLAQELQAKDGTGRNRAVVASYSDAARTRIRGVYMATWLKGGVLAKAARELAAELDRTEGAILQQFIFLWRREFVEGAFRASSYRRSGIAGGGGDEAQEALYCGGFSYGRRSVP
jgi:hypothetical protein